MENINENEYVFVMVNGLTFRRFNDDPDSDGSSPARGSEGARGSGAPRGGTRGAQRGEALFGEGTEEGEGSDNPSQNDLVEDLGL